MATEPQILQVGIFAIQVCVPSEWTDQQVSDWAREEYIKRLKADFEKVNTHSDAIADLIDDIRMRYTFAIAKEGDEVLRAGSIARAQCDDHSGHVHLVLHL